MTEQNTRYYVDLKLSGSNEELKRQVFGKALKIVHGIKSDNEESTLAVGFPGLQITSKKDTATLGSTMRVVGEQFDALHFFKNPVLDELAEQVGLEVHKVRPVPEEEVLDVHFARDRYTSNYDRDSRGKVMAKFTPYVLLHSNSSNKNFKMHVTLAKASGKKAYGHNNYGLAKANATFPMF